MLEALDQGILAGVATDAGSIQRGNADDPLFQRLRSHPKIIATPHIGGNTHEITVHQSRIVVSDLERLYQGERPVHVVNPETLQDFRWREEPKRPRVDDA